MLCCFSPFHGRALVQEPGAPADLSSLHTQEQWCQVESQPRAHGSDGWGRAAEGLAGSYMLASKEDKKTLLLF